MSRYEKEKWDRKHRRGDYNPPDSPTEVLDRYIERIPAGRALDLATGTGRNALFLARNGYTVDAIDISREALDEAKQKEENNFDINWIHGDLDLYCLPSERYDVINVSYYYNSDMIEDIKSALKQNGVLIYQHHLSTMNDVSIGPSDDEVRFSSNELLERCTDLTVLYYEEGVESVEELGGTSAFTAIVARKSSRYKQRYAVQS